MLVHLTSFFFESFHGVKKGSILSLQSVPKKRLQSCNYVLVKIRGKKKDLSSVKLNFSLLNSVTA